MAKTGGHAVVLGASVDPARHEEIGEELSLARQETRLIDVALPILMSFSVCAMFQSPHTTASRPEAFMAAMRCASVAMKRSFSSCRGVSASPVWM